MKILALILALALTACGQDETDEPGPAAPRAELTPTDEPCEYVDGTGWTGCTDEEIDAANAKAAADAKAAFEAKTKADAEALAEQKAAEELAAQEEAERLEAEAIAAAAEQLALEEEAIREAVESIKKGDSFETMTEAARDLILNTEGFFRGTRSWSISHGAVSYGVSFDEDGLVSQVVNLITNIKTANGQ